jgi:16S rRNA U516 pseudouridylate synthase RsuA-like enzyme
MKRQIQEMCRQFGLPVVRIVRIRIGTLRLGNLQPRQWRHLTTKEIEELRQPFKGIGANGFRGSCS